LTHTDHTLPSTVRSALVSVITLLVLTVTLSSCATVTTFPEHPEEHPLLKEQKQWPHAYYFMVERGVFSRLVGLQPEALMRSLLSAVEARWPAISRLQTPDALMTYFRSVGLTPIAERIEVTLNKNAASRPSDVDHRLEAAAIKKGLVAAFYEVKQASH
jgi:hypothetical protein